MEQLWLYHQRINVVGRQQVGSRQVVYLGLKFCNLILLITYSKTTSIKDFNQKHISFSYILLITVQYTLHSTVHCTYEAPYWPEALAKAILFEKRSGLGLGSCYFQGFRLRLLSDVENFTIKYTGASMVGMILSKNGHIMVSIRHLWTNVIGQMTPCHSVLLTGKLQEWSNVNYNVLKQREVPSIYGCLDSKNVHIVMSIRHLWTIVMIPMSPGS